MRRQTLRSVALFGSDLLCFLGAWLAAVTVAAWAGKAERDQWFPPSTPGGVAYTLMAIAVIVALVIGGHYARRAAFWEEIRVAWQFSLIAALTNFAVNFLTQVTFTRTLLVLVWVFALVLLPLGRLVTREALISLGWWKCRALVVGNGENAVHACAAIRQERNMGIELAGLAGGLPEAGIPQAAIQSFPVEEGVEEIASRLGCEVIVVALEEGSPLQAPEIVNSLDPRRFEVFVVPALQGLPVQGMQAQYFFSNDVLFLHLRLRLFGRWSQFLKRSFDIAAASALLVALSPLMAFVAWRIWREDGSPVFYTQLRVGQGGRDIRFIKFRSMVRDADAVLAQWKTSNPELYARYEQENFKLAADPRVLRVGGWIRRSSIDELPQLWNVLRGEMSLVGPRPLLRRELPKYPADLLRLYERVRPGITGLWQVSGRSTTTFEQRAAMDSWYVRNWSLWVDWVILLKTVRVVVSGRGAM